MYPILFKVGPITIYSYGFFLAIAYIVATFFIWSEGRKRGYKEEKLIDFSVVSLIAAIVGGRLFYTFINYSFFSNNFLKILAFWEGGFAYYGSFFFVIITTTFLIRKWKWDFFQIADLSVLAVLLATFFGKIGSFLAGNDFGSITNFPISVMYPFLEGRRHPVQIYEATFAILLFIFLYRMYHSRLTRLSELRSGAVFFYYLIFWSIGRIVLEQIRGDSTFVGNFQLHSLIAGIVAIFSVFGLYYYQFRNFSSDFSTISKNILGLKYRFRR